MARMRGSLLIPALAVAAGLSAGAQTKPAPARPVLAKAAPAVSAESQGCVACHATKTPRIGHRTWRLTLPEAVITSWLTPG
jgi:hypothetical protein